MLQYGEHSFDPTTMHPKSVAALTQFGLAHFLGNVQAAKMVGKIRAAIVDEQRARDPETKFKAENVSKEMVQAFRADHKDAIDAWAQEHLKEALKELQDGSIGLRATGPRKDPVEAKYQELLTKRAKAWVKKNDYKWPKDDETKIVFGNGKERTRVELMATLEKTAGEKLRKEAERIVAIEAKQTQAARVADAGAVDPDEIA